MRISTCSTARSARLRALRRRGPQSSGVRSQSMGLGQADSLRKREQGGLKLDGGLIFLPLPMALLSGDSERWTLTGWIHGECLGRIDLSSLPMDHP